VEEEGWGGHGPKAGRSAIEEEDGEEEEEEKRNSVPVNMRCDILTAMKISVLLFWTCRQT
jgi:hypothetical protein